MNIKRLGLISAMACLICVILAIYVNEASTRTIHVAGQDVECRIRNRKLTIEDFEAVEIDEDIYEADLKEQIGEPDGYFLKDVGEPNLAGIGTMVYILEDGRTVVPFFGMFHPVVYSFVIYEGDDMVSIIKESEYSFLRVDSDEIRAYGVTFTSPSEDKRYTLEDFEDVELPELSYDVFKKIGGPNHWSGSGLPGNPMYVLKDGRCVVLYLMNDWVYGITLWKGDSMECILKAVDESDIRKVYFNGGTLEYVARHRNLTVEDFENIELGTPRSEIVEKIGERDASGWRNLETDKYNQVYVLEDDKVAKCYFSADNKIEKIVIYDGDDIDLVIENAE